MSSTLYFKTQIDNIRNDVLKLEFSIKTMDGYKFIWNSYIKWKNENDFNIKNKNMQIFY